MSITAISRNFDGNPNIVYIVCDDTLATITAAGYLTGDAISAQIEALNNGAFQWLDTDIVLISYAPSFLINFFKYDATNATFVSNPASGGISTSLVSGNMLVGSAGNVATSVTMSGDATMIASGALTIANAAINSAKLNPLALQYIAVPISAAEFNGAYAAPIQLIAAPGANKLIVLERCQLLLTYGSAAFAAGGVTALQYDSTINGAGVIASTTQAAANFQVTASTGIVFNAGVVAEPFTTCVNKNLSLSNITGAFTTGNSTMVAHVWYKVIPTV